MRGSRGTGTSTPPRAPATATVEDTVVVPDGRADPDAEFAAFVRAASPELGRAAWYLCGDPVRAEDLLQHALLRTYLAWGRLGGGDPVAYTRRILTNSRIDSWRKDRRETLTAPLAMPDPAADDGSAARAERDRLGHALRALPTQQRRVVVLRHLLGLSEAETAAELGVSLGTVKSTASRGLARLRDLLAEPTGTATSIPEGSAR
ncbi:SigE family RNA polymerase sigma factor [Actinotalea sp. K2]|uniref:SigE family RNA polymerase sigma factor n=1 Tax=Actinotalea sp. K2 TaxID=2939438 RepID=UPI00201772C0|nr:SigE family RNA polymerase sigma factor [Actinotalea sp. K2]MCL3861143.1 SigE family RNA polymerase sigma factor [Actinotalea sp. K2]